MKKYLYLLPFEEKGYFKIGISSGSFSRVLFHNTTYKVNLNKSLIITAKPGVISAFEKELLCIFPKPKTNEFNGCDGYTEIRDIKFMEEAVLIINDKHKALNVKINKFYDLWTLGTHINTNVKKPSNKKTKDYFDTDLFNSSWRKFVSNIGRLGTPDKIIQTAPCSFDFIINKSWSKIPVFVQNMQISINTNIVSQSIGILSADKHEKTTILHMNLKLHDEIKDRKCIEKIRFLCNYLKEKSV